MSNEKMLARRALRRAVANGIIDKPTSCSDCGRTVEAKDLGGHHHNGYDEEHWLDVVWLCRNCHGRCHGGALLITNEQRYAGAQTRLRTETSEQRQQRKKWGRELGRRYGRDSMTQFNASRTPEERSEHARRAAESVPRDRVGGKGKPRPCIQCDDCKRWIAVSWLKRHQSSNCRLG
jgi:hypothetical protein